MKKLSTLISVILLSASLAACGSGSDSKSSSNTINVGTIPVPSVAGIYIGIDQGLFKDAGVKVVPKVATGFAPNLAAVINGESQVGFAAVIPLLVAKSKGAPIKIIAGTDAAPTTYDAATDPDNVFTMPDSNIDSPKDLEGKTVAVNALGSIQDLGVKVMVTEDGGDTDKVKLLALPLNDMVTALKGGRVDAIALSEPFSAAARKEGLKPLFSYVTSPTPGAPVGAYFTSQATIAKSGSLIGKFVDAITKANSYAQAHPDAVKKALPTYTKIPADVVADVHTFPYATKISEQQISDLSEVLVKYGYIDKAVSAKDILR